ncbi:MAG: host-nuclease inhibitor Gam family protein, partial [Treponemataceae bacterium]
MARYKPSTGKLENLNDVDLALKEIGVMERELEVIDAKANEKILAIKNDAKKKGEVMRKNIAELSAKIGSYAEYNKDELFKDRKSVNLTFGVFGFRKSTSISVKKTTVELLKKLNLFDFLNIKETPDKDKMSAMDDETLAQVDAVRKVKDDFFCEP